VRDSFIPNPRQREAIEHVSGPMLVLAGAGTGKTTVLVERIAWLIEQKHARAEEILAITFTENAAQELVERVEKRLRRKAAVNAGTFNAYCNGVLQRNGRGFFVLTKEDVYVFLRQRIEQLELERFIKPSDLGEFLHDLQEFFDRCHEELITPERFQEYVNALRPGANVPRNCRTKQIEELGEEEIIARWHEIARAYRNSLRLLEGNGLGVFGMQISNAVRLLQSDAGLLEHERRKARFILIDEFQDCNSSNIILAGMLAGEEQNIFVVGDPDQAIYRFRGASSAAFVEFQKRFPHTRGVVLDENQRSRGNILRVAFRAISENPPVPSLGQAVQFDRNPLQSARDLREQESGMLVFDEQVDVVICGSHDQEAALIAGEIELLRKNARPGDKLSMAVLYRQHLHRERMMQELAGRRIPFIVVGMNVLETGPARDLLAVARAVSNPNDAESLFRVCALPRFGMEGEELRKKLATAGHKSTFRGVLATMETGMRVLDAVREAGNFIAAEKLSAAQALGYLVREFELEETHPVIQAVLRFAAVWEEKPFLPDISLAEFLGYLRHYIPAGGIIPLFSEEQMAELEREFPDAVRLMTVHAAKGLEFTHVWLLRVNSGSFPTNFKTPLFEFPAELRGSVAMGDGKEIHDQEERRLFYVAITRARDRLTIGGRPGRGRDKAPAGYLKSLLQDLKLRPALAQRFAGGATPVEPPPDSSPILSWMLLPPSFVGRDLPLSANAVQNYATCPMKFKLQRDWRVPGDAAAALQYGNAIHTVLKHYYDPAAHAQQLDAEAAVQAFEKEFAKSVIEDPVQRRMYEEMGAKQLRAVIAARPRESVEVLAAEYKINFRLGELEIVGRIDRMDRMAGDLVRVVDYKTGSPKDQRFADDSLQLSIYAMGVSRLGYTPRELVLVNVQDATEVASFRTPKQLETAQRKIEEAAEGIARGRFEATPGPHCVWCEFRKLCPATEQRIFLPVGALAREAEAKTAGAQ
jgi:DNA helicase II / ATP-dependent DNA helicase PcrA